MHASVSYKITYLNTYLTLLSLFYIGNMITFAYHMVGNMTDSREHILQTAYLLFVKKSYKAVTFKELMEKTGFSKGAFYHYFKSKEHIFEEIINNYFLTFESFDFNQLSHSSFRKFLNEYFKILKEKRAELSIVDPETGKETKHYQLIFEALQIMPSLRAKILTHEAKELAAWKMIIKKARDTNEISSKLSDTQLARLFINSSDGTAIHLIMTDKTDDMEKDIKAVWDSLYTLIKM